MNHDFHVKIQRLLLDPNLLRILHVTANMTFTHLTGPGLRFSAQLHPNSIDGGVVSMASSFYCWFFFWPMVDSVVETIGFRQKKRRK